MSMLQQLRDAAGKLNPKEVRDEANQPIAVRLRASSERGYDELFRFLLPDSYSEGRRRHAASQIYLDGETAPPKPFDLTLVERGVPAMPDEFVYHPNQEEKLVREILEQRASVAVPLARSFAPFREEYSRNLVRRISLENAMFALATAVPNIAPFLGLVWAPGEFASGTALLTLNQIRMIFLLGGANDRQVGYSEQKSEIASVITGAFGWRAVARELVGKIPAGGGLLPKAAIAYAGTWVVGSSIERLYRIGYGYTRQERSTAYSDAFERGRELAGNLLSRARAKGAAGGR